MNDERFIEMLNLYIDRELAGEEIHEIEEAIASSPERQRIYAQYCRIERATQRLLTETEVPRPSIPALVAAAQTESGSVVDFPPATQAKPIWQTWGGAVAGLAAACFAVVVYFSTVTSPSATDLTPSVVSPPSASASLDTVESPVYQTVFVLDRDETNDRLPGMRAEGDSFAWMTQLQFAPIERTDLDGWEMQAAAPIEVRSLNARWVSPVAIEKEGAPEAMTAFQFQR